MYKYFVLILCPVHEYIGLIHQFHSLYLHMLMLAPRETSRRLRASMETRIYILGQCCKTLYLRH